MGVAVKEPTLEETLGVAVVVAVLEEQVEMEPMVIHLPHALEAVGHLPLKMLVMQIVPLIKICWEVEAVGVGSPLVTEM